MECEGEGQGVECEGEGQRTQQKYRLCHNAHTHARFLSPLVTVGMISYTSADQTNSREARQS